MPAVDLLKRMAAAYASARTYSDQGIVRTVFIKGTERREVLRPFSTYFERPGRFYFTYRQEPDGHPQAICRNGGAASLLAGEEEVDVLRVSTAVAALTGVSGGSSHTISRLLMPTDVRGWSLEALEEPQVQGEEEIDGHVCHRIVGQYQRSNPTTIWLDAAQYLIRKIFDTDRFDGERRRAIEDSRLRAIGIPDELRPPSKMVRESDFDTETTTTYRPLLDAPIDPAIFEFPPKRAR